MRKITSERALKTTVGKGVVLLDFNTAWCGPCAAQKPILCQLADRYCGRVVFAELNIDRHRNIAAKFGIRSIPTLILFQNGREILRLVGMQGVESLSNVLDEVLSV